MNRSENPCAKRVGFSPAASLNGRRKDSLSSVFSVSSVRDNKKNAGQEPFLLVADREIETQFLQFCLAWNPGFGIPTSDLVVIFEEFFCLKDLSG